MMKQGKRSHTILAGSLLFCAALVTSTVIANGTQQGEKVFDIESVHGTASDQITFFADAINILESDDYIDTNNFSDSISDYLDGWVKIEYSLDANRIPYDIEIIQSIPDGIFDQAALKSLSDSGCPIDPENYNRRITHGFIFEPAESPYLHIGPGAILGNRSDL